MDQQTAARIEDSLTDHFKPGTTPGVSAPRRAGNRVTLTTINELTDGDLDKLADLKETYKVAREIKRSGAGLTISLG